ncbi:DUF4382 domain-containing protein [Pseudoalteromonas sp. OF7H-1]|uniref:DUF4382 domain-containing protein n=1 Tax=Pseudoalteromonas sp. OF7H-1 TaxID=2917755 RepID=UPI001EF74836|nr:DUF4382 domain-containing protein [Pseudoalteromonas sp. OF7H-1]MCG7539822.1 DUF4382 domain-containing protein [Pseudoalteromonas sp. OF7H-1]
MYKPALTAIASAMILAACGGGSGSDSNDNNTTQPTEKTTVSVGVSDAAVNNLAEVNLVIQRLTFRASGKEDVTFDTLDAQGNPMKINLLEYTGDDIYLVVNDQEIDAGDYEWIRADVVNGSAGSNFDLTSSVRFLDGSQAPLAVTRKGNDGVGEIQLNNFSLNEGENQIVLEFDLNKALLKRTNDDTVYLKPTAVRLENLLTSFEIEGMVSESVKNACIADNADLAPLVGEYKHVVYLYKADVAVPSDISDEGSAPVATANLDAESEYEIAFIGSGDYKVGYSCLGHLDDAETIDADFSLYQTKDVTLTQDTEVNFETN